VHKLVRFYAAPADGFAVVRLIETVPQTHPVIGSAILDAVATAWPEERPPQLSAEQRAILQAAARGAPALADGFAKVAARWTLADVFKSQ
jgi:hypothetical protein